MRSNIHVRTCLRISLRAELGLASRLVFEDTMRFRDLDPSHNVPSDTERGGLRELVPHNDITASTIIVFPLKTLLLSLELTLD